MTFVHVVVTNTYQRTSSVDPKPAVMYWESTKDYWSQIRTLWDARIRRDRGTNVGEGAEAGSRTGSC